MRTRRAQSYAWALHSDLGRASPRGLSDSARLGLEYAERLARDASLRSRQALRNQPALDPLTVAQLAEEENVPARVISARISRARKELFGTLTDSGIHKRQQAQRATAARRRQLRVCAHPGCPRPLPA